jgi:hypothetical protein
MTLPEGRYRLRLYIRGLAIGEGLWGTHLSLCPNSTSRDANYTGRKKPANTFGWMPLTYVFDAHEGYKFRLAFGLYGNGHLWVDDVSLEKVTEDIALTQKPVFGEPETDITMPGPLPDTHVRCPHCAWRNDPAWGTCFACGHELAREPKRTYTTPETVVFADFEDGTRAPFNAGEVVKEHAASGGFSLRLDEGHTDITTRTEPYQNWAEHTHVKFDVFNPQRTPAALYVEVRDTATAGYWTRVNINTVAPPGKSTVTIPTALYVGEKARPGRGLLRDKVTRFVVSVGKDGPVYLDHFRLVREDISSYTFEGLNAFDFGPMNAPRMEAFTAAGMPTVYSKGRGYGWTKVKSAHSPANVLQPDPLYQDFLCLADATFRVDVPDGKYRVFMNIDYAHGYWGEVQVFKHRKVTANGKVVVDETMTREKFLKRHFRNASREDLPGVDTFEEYVETMFDEKTFEVEVTDGALELGFESDDWGITLSCLVIYPERQKARGERFLAWVKERRRAQFNDYFKQTNPAPAGAKRPDTGYRVFGTYFMDLAQAFDGPREGWELAPGDALEVSCAQGEERALTFALQPGEDLGEVGVTISKMVGPGGAVLDAAALRPGWISYRISRVQPDGSVYTVSPRYWYPVPAPASPGVTRNFWVRVKPSTETVPGEYRGTLTLRPAEGRERPVPITVTVLPFALDPVTDIAAGPWGSGIGSGWHGGDEADRDAQQAWNWRILEKSLDALSDIGCTSFSGRPNIRIYGGHGKIRLGTETADREMDLIRAKGFIQMISSYGAANYIRLYTLGSGPTAAKAKEAGFESVQALLDAAWRAVDDHAVEAGWVPVAWNLCDEPRPDQIPRIVENAKRHREAARGLKRTFFMGATSMQGDDPEDPHYELCRSLQIPTLNLHDESSLRVIEDAGGLPAIYNNGNRWGFGRYLKMLVVKHHVVMHLTWHYNNAAGDPYYALDCREDDYCWFNTNAEGELIPAVVMMSKVRPGFNDYRYLSTLQRLIREKPGHPNAAVARGVFDEMMDLEAGRDRRREVDFEADRAKVATAIESLLK